MTSHLALDLALLLVLLVHALRGWRTGGLVGIASLAGLVSGAWLGLWATPHLIDRFLPQLQQGPGHASLLLVGVVLCATLGESLGASLGMRLRRHTRTATADGLDRVVGCLTSLLVTSLVITLLAGAVRPVLPASWASVLNRSRVLPALDAAVPDPMSRWASGFTDQLGQGFPRVFSGLSPEPVIPVPAPDAGAARGSAVARSAAGVVKIEADASACDENHAGSGWVVARERVVTNAHVVAGARQVNVKVGGLGRGRAATVVAFDPNLDLAILHVPGLRAAPLQRSGPLAPRADAVVAGFPLGGDYTVRPARVRGVVDAAGDDIYGGKGVEREVYSLAGTVQPGNSGGPLLATDGTVAGTVFARSLVDTSTGYALTDAATDALLDRAPQLGTAVSTQGCAKQ
ncbi:MarP family serine protease [Luteococcus peritonei]|uniref:MarP family serine protease n=1 Tax=Luteococcus peritonei TaxID=88874 RepID=A0ABW4RTF3_9ACTN